MNKDKLLEWLEKQLDAKSKQCDRLVEEGSDESGTLGEWGAYLKVTTMVKNGAFDD